MQGKRFAFAGNRASVLIKMRELGLDVVKIWAVKGSYLQRYLEQNDIAYCEVEKKSILIEEIQNTEFDYFISNGLPIILPIEKLQKDGKKFINIHPSLLPELRGKDPVPGALLYRKEAGVTCHYMDDGIDTGEIIAQVKIDSTPDLEAGLLYQLSFIAEAEVFEKAYRKNFASEGKQSPKGNEIYYSFKPDDLKIDLEKESVEAIVAKVKAFATRNKLSYFECSNVIYRCSDVQIMENCYLYKVLDGKEGILMRYEDKILYRKENKILKFTINSGGHNEN